MDKLFGNIKKEKGLVMNKISDEGSGNNILNYISGSRKLFLFFGVLLVLTFGLVFVSAPSTLSAPGTCCEKTIGGAFCVNTINASQCDPGYKSSPTSCETTSYCRLGTCYDSSEGICSENTPQNICDSDGGTWDSRKIEEVPQCQLGCCIIADQAAFVPLVRCKQLSTYYGVENNYDPSITNEVACIAKAQGQDKGACVFEKDFERTCQFTTREKCGASEEVVSASQNKTEPGKRTFYEGFLCSAEELNTNCARQTSTSCSEGKVYWKDSCGNLENVYSSDKTISWNSGKVIDANRVCNPNDGSNKNCGNCDYLLGTTCQEWSGVLGIGKPQDSDFFCKRTECKDRNGEARVNGESWCVYDSEVGEGNDKVGSRHFREICVDGNVQVEACEDFRLEVCLQDSIETSNGGEFGTAACRLNRWQDCTMQMEEEDCLNIDKRDCMWLPPVKGLDLLNGTIEGQTAGFSGPKTGNAFSDPATTTTGNTITGSAIAGEDSETKTTTNRKDGVCVPNYPPGFNFWSDTRSDALCGQASATCAVVYEEGLFGGKKIVSGGECLKEQWALDANRVCTSLGDCGGYVNYNNVYTDDGYTWTKDDDEMQFTPNSINIVSGGFSGQVINALRRMNG